MFRFSQIGSRFLSYWSYKGEILHWNFWPLSLHYSLIVPTCWYPKTLHIPFWTMKQTNSLSMCRMNFDTTTCFFWCSRLFQNSFSNAKLFVGHFVIIFVFWNEYPVIILWFFSPLVFNPNQMCPNSYFIQFWMEICHFDTIHFLSFLFYKIPLLISKNEINQNTITK